MKKRFVLITLLLLAGSSMGLVYLVSSTERQASAPKSSDLDEHALFIQSERSLRQIIRQGNERSANDMTHTLEMLASQLDKRNHEGLNTHSLNQALSDYREDASVIIKGFLPYQHQLHLYDTFESEHEKQFVTSLEQIGFYQLKSAYEGLDKIRLSYIKKPSSDGEKAYHLQEEAIRTIITELYLDTAIEAPLLAFLENHTYYFDTIAKAYTELGYDRINRLRTNAFSIKTELQLLPKS